MTAKRAVGFAPCEFCNEWSASACGVACEIRSFLSSPPAVPVPRVSAHLLGLHSGIETHEQLILVK